MCFRPQWPQHLPLTILCEPFLCQVNHQRKSFQVFAPSQTDKDIWMTNLKTYCEAAGPSTLGTVAGESRAVWVPDHLVKKCMVCDEKEFSMLVRRHHCRKCGKVVCGPCSAYKAILNKGKAERICALCHGENQGVRVVAGADKGKKKPKPKKKDSGTFSSDSSSSSER